MGQFMMNGMAEIFPRSFIWQGDPVLHEFGETLFTLTDRGRFDIGLFEIVMGFVSDDGNTITFRQSPAKIFSDVSVSFFRFFGCKFRYFQTPFSVIYVKMRCLDELPVKRIILNFILSE